MKRPLRRRLALGFALVASLAAVTASPAAAAADTDVAPTECHVLLAGPTPSVEADIDGDGRPDVRVPSLTNVRLCVTSNVELDLPSVESVDCGPFPMCKAFYVDYGVSGSASAQTTFCYTADGSQVCGTTTPIYVPINFIRGGRICVGYDFGGGSPCGGGLVSFE